MYSEKPLVKTCYICKVEKEIKEFNKCKSFSDGIDKKCRECNKEQSRLWKIKNPDAFKEWSKNKSRTKYNQDYRKEHSIKRKIQWDAWYKNNAAKMVAKANARSERIRLATPPWADLKAIEHFYIEAARLTKETGIKHEVDHIHPIKGKFLCGLHCEHNLQIITKEENLKKGNKMPEDFVMSLSKEFIHD